jgi:hypothetical protein
MSGSTFAMLDHIRVHNSFKLALKTRLNWWSKNVQDECDAPWQVILLGSMNAVLVHLR